MIKQAQPTHRAERQNPHSKNFGLRSRDIDTAARNALAEKFHAGQIGYGSVHTHHQKFQEFSRFVKTEHNITDMRDIEKQHIENFADKLNERFEKGEILPSTAQNILSSVNTVMSQAIGNNSLKVSAKECGLPPRTGIATENKACSSEQHRSIVNQLPERLAVMSEMQRNLGLRFEESCKANAQQMLRDAISRQAVNVEYGSKGGQARTIAITSSKQLDALQQAANVQGNHHSMIPKNMTYVQFQSSAYKEYSQHNYRAHSERHAYAQQSYAKHLEAITKVPNIQCPVEAGIKHGAPHHQYLSQKIGCSIKQAKLFDQQARMLVAKEMGHHRINITNSYLG